MGGTFHSSTTTQTTTWSVSVPGGSVGVGNRFTVEAEFDAPGTAAFTFNGVNVLIDPWPLEGVQPLVHLHVWRTGNNTALVRPWFGNGGGNVAMVPGGRFPVAGLNWNTGQDFAIACVGCVLQRAGVAR